MDRFSMVEAMYFYNHYKYSTTYEKLLIHIAKSTHCLKIAQKFAFNIASEASYVYTFSKQKLIKIAKNGTFLRSFSKTEAVPDRSTLIGQKLVENAKIEKFKGDILGDFQKCVFCSTKISKIWLWTPIQRRYFDFKKMYLRVKIQFFSLFEYNTIFDEVVCALLCLKIQFSKGGFKALLHFWHSSLYSL